MSRYLAVYILFGKMLGILLQNDIIGLIFIDANGQILKNNLTVWSHWLQLTELTKKFLLRWNDKNQKYAIVIKIVELLKRLASNAFLSKLPVVPFLAASSWWRWSEQSKRLPKIYWIVRTLGSLANYKDVIF